MLVLLGITLAFIYVNFLPPSIEHPGDHDEVRRLRREARQHKLSMEQRAKPADEHPNLTELMRLRSEIGSLREQVRRLSVLTNLPPNRTASNQPPLVADRILAAIPEPTEEDRRIISILGMEEAKLRATWDAVKAYATANEGRLPPSSAEIKLHLSPEEDPVPLALWSGGDHSLTALQRDRSTVLYKDTLIYTLSDGRRCRLYLLATGETIYFQE